MILKAATRGLCIKSSASCTYDYIFHFSLLNIRHSRPAANECQDILNLGLMIWKTNSDWDENVFEIMMEAVAPTRAREGG